MAIYRNEDIYPYIVLIDDVAYLERAAEPISVADVMNALGAGAKPEAVAKLYGLTVDQVHGAEDFARDCWLTPEPLAKLLPPRHRLMDPCSNPRSFVDASIRYMLEQGLNGLMEPWSLLAYVNAGFSDLLPWVDKLRAEQEFARAKTPPAELPRLEGACFMVNHDHSTLWYRELVDLLPCQLQLDKRQQFVPHPGVAKSTNNKPQSLIGDRAFFEACDPKIFELGRMYEQTKSRRVA